MDIESLSTMFEDKEDTIHQSFLQTIQDLRIAIAQLQEVPAYRWSPQLSNTLCLLYQIIDTLSAQQQNTVYKADPGNQTSSTSLK